MKPFYEQDGIVLYNIEVGDFDVVEGKNVAEIYRETADLIRVDSKKD